MRDVPTTPDGRRVIATTAGLLLSPLDWVLDAIADAGFTGTELLVSHDADTRDPAGVARRAAEAGLDVPVVHGPYMVLLRRVLASSYIDKSRRSLELAAELGAATMVAHAPYRWERRARGWLAEADAEAAEAGTRFAMENLYAVGGRKLSSVVTTEELTAFDHVVFDTSHFGMAGIDLVEAWEALAGRVVHLHVSDNFGQGKDSHAPLGEGVLDLAGFLAHVGRSGFTGTVALELDCRPYLDTRESLVGFLAEQRRRAERGLAGLELTPTPQRHRGGAPPTGARARADLEG